MGQFNIVHKIKGAYKRVMYAFAAILMLTSTITPVALAAPTFSSYATSSSYEDPTHVTTAGGSLWYIEQTRTSPYPDNYIGNMTTSGTVTDYSLGTPSGTTGFTVYSLTTGSDGNVWFDGVANTNGVYTGFLNISTGAVTFYYASAVTYDIPGPIVTGSDGNLYFYELTANSPNYTYIHEVNPSTGATTIARTITDTYAQFSSMTSGPDGNLWVTDDNGGWVYSYPVGTTGTGAAYRVPATDTNPRSLITGPDGNLWLVGSTNILKLTTSGTFTEYSTPSGTIPYSLTAASDGAVWFLDGNSTTPQVGRITRSGSITDYPIPGSSIHNVAGLTLGPDNNLWFGYGVGSTYALGSITTTPTFSNDPISSSYEYPISTTTAGGSLWYIEENKTTRNDTYIGNMTTSGTVTDHTIGIPSGSGVTSFIIDSLTSGPDGNVWFDGVANTNQIYTGLLNIATGTATFYATGAWTYGRPSQLITGSDGNLYFYELTSTSPNYTYLYYVSPASGVATIARTIASTYTQYSSITSGPDGRIWITDDNGGWVDVYPTGTTGTGSTYRVPAAYTNPRSIVAGPDGNLWLVGSTNILKLTTSGIFTAYTPASGVIPYYLTAGPDGAVWFLDGNSTTPQVGRITSSGVITEYPIPGSSLNNVAGLTSGPDGAMWFSYGAGSTYELGRLGY